MGKIISEAKIAYTAGFLDADGAIMAVIEQHREKRFGFRVRVVVKITQKDKNVLDWFHRTYNVGQITNNTRAHEWLIRDQSDAKIFLKVICPYLKSKQRQAVIALQILDYNITTKEELVHVARLADTLSGFNVRSKNRRKNYATKIQETISRND